MRYIVISSIAQALRRMSDASTHYIDVSQLRIGHFVYIDLGWLSHPFPLNAFKIRSRQQLETIRALRLERIRYDPDKSDPQAMPTVVAVPIVDPLEAVRRERQALLAAQRVSLAACERSFNQTARSWREVVERLGATPELARQSSEAAVDGVLAELAGDDETSIRLLSESAGERASLHAVNVSVLSLLLGRTLKLSPLEMRELGVGALLHDIGKLDLPNRLRSPDEQFTRSEIQLYREHVAHGVAAGRRMNLSQIALRVIAEHHEHCDGSGFPAALSGPAMSRPAQIVALINQYDTLVNAPQPGRGVTPHEALSLMFAQQKARFDPTVLAAFIRMMGIYPPGSVVQMNDDRYALVVSVNTDRPLRPRVIIYQPEIPVDQALVVDLETVPEIGIRRSLKPQQLPKATFDYLSPRERACYYFERAAEPLADRGAAQ